MQLHPLPRARPRCERCRRPVSACWCVELTPVETATRVVFLQHPREARVAIGTARMAHLGLAGSELHTGTDFTRHPRVAEILAGPGTVLLFPGVGARTPAEFAGPPRTLVVLDGTWPQARKLMALNPALRALPRLGFVPRRPGNYRIRREPAAHCLATVEAIVEVLGHFEPDPARFRPLLRAFDGMVERQLAATKARRDAPRRRFRRAGPWWLSTAMPDLDALWSQLVVVTGEANAYRRGSGPPGAPEVVQWAAIRLATGEVFQAYLAPRRPLAPNAARHLEVSESCLLEGIRVDRMLQDWDSFVGPADRLVSWGGFACALLAAEGWRPAIPPLDLRVVAAQRLKKRPGALESVVRALGAESEDGPILSVPGRAGRNLRAVSALVRALRREQQEGRGSDPGE